MIVSWQYHRTDINPLNFVFQSRCPNIPGIVFSFDTVTCCTNTFFFENLLQVLDRVGISRHMGLKQSYQNALIFSIFTDAGTQIKGVIENNRPAELEIKIINRQTFAKILR